MAPKDQPFYWSEKNTYFLKINHPNAVENEQKQEVSGGATHLERKTLQGGFHIFITFSLKVVHSWCHMG